MATSPVSQMGPISTQQVAATGILATPPPASAVVSFDPAGTGGVGSGNLRINANAGKGMPAWNLQLNPGDGTALRTFIRAELNPATGLNRIHIPEELDVDGAVTIAGVANLTGDSSGSLTLNSAAPGALLLNYYSGNRVVFCDGAENQVGFVDAAGNASFNGNLTIAGSATVGGSPVVTIATLPPGNMVYPGVGIGVSTGSAWGASINPATLQGKLTLTTTGSSGAATLVGNTLNVPQYSGAVQVYPGAGLAVSTGAAWGSSIDPTTLQGKLTLTTTGSSGAATLVGNTLNVPQYSGAVQVYPGAGLAVSTGSAWGTSIAAPSGALVGTTDVQTLTNKTIDGVTPATMAFVDPTSSIQTQFNGKQGTLTLTTTGSSGAATLVGNTLNIPQYAGGGMVYPGAGIPQSTGAAWGTSITLAAGMAAFLATPSSANLAATLTDETGTGANVFATNPVLVTPNLGTPSALVLTNATGLTTAGILASQVTLTKIQNAAASSKLLGSGAAGIGAAYSEITLGTGLSMSGTTLNASGAGMVYPAAGVPVSTGAAWGTSIVQANIAMVNVSNTFTVDQNFGGKASFAGGDFIIGLSSTPIAKANIRADGASPEDIAMSPAPGGSLYLNWDNGNGVVFGNGAGGGAASITAAGSASFNGTLSVAGAGTVGLLAVGTHVAGNPKASVGASGTSIVIDPASSGNIYFNYDTSSNFIICDGAHNNIATIDISGNAHFNGTVTAGTKSFRIPHPLHKDRDLMHSCLEGPEIGVYYRGEAVTKKGTAEVTLPDYFEALTTPTGRTVQLTEVFEFDEDQVIGANKLAMLAASRVKDGKFHVRSSEPITRFYWEVKAIRADQPTLAVTVEKRREMRPETIEAGAAQTQTTARRKATR